MAERYKLIGCEVLFREACLCAAESKNIIDPEFLTKGLHDMGETRMSESLQKVIDQVDPDKYDAILLCYGLCNNGVSGLRARVPMVIPKAHDCITLFLGSKEKYTDYFHNNPGAFFHTSGWLERGLNGADGDEALMTQLGIRYGDDYDQYAEEYGEENAAYIMEIFGDWTKNYKKFTYINTGVGDAAAYEARSQAEAQERGWEYERIQGDIRLIRALIDGDWNEDDFLVVPPGHEIAASFDEAVMCHRAVTEDGAR